MPKEINLQYPDFLGPDNGGDLTSFTEDGEGYVAYTKYGEFSCELTDQGGLLAEFPENGLTFYYSDEGNLELAVLDLGDYLSGLNAAEVNKLPNGGENIYGIVKYLEDNGLAMCVFLGFKKKDLEVVLFDDNGESTTVEKVENADFRKGLSGVAGVGGFEVAFEFTDYGDDVLMAVGETDGKDTKLNGVEFSNFVDFEDDLFGNDPKRFSRLASKIILQ